jgi:hypothetical protein
MKSCSQIRKVHLTAKAPNAAGMLGASLTHVFQVMKVQPASTV